MLLVQGGREAVAAQAGLEPLHPLGRTMRTFSRLSQRRPRPVVASIGANFRRNLREFLVGFLVPSHCVET